MQVVISCRDEKTRAGVVLVKIRLLESDYSMAMHLPTESRWWADFLNPAEAKVMAYGRRVLSAGPTGVSVRPSISEHRNLARPHIVRRSDVGGENSLPAFFDRVSNASDPSEPVRRQVSGSGRGFRSTWPVLWSPHEVLGPEGPVSYAYAWSSDASRSAGSDCLILFHGLIRGHSYSGNGLARQRVRRRFASRRHRRSACGRSRGSPRGSPARYHRSGNMERKRGWNCPLRGIQHGPKLSIDTMPLLQSAGADLVRRLGGSWTDRRTRYFGSGVHSGRCRVWSALSLMPRGGQGAALRAARQVALMRSRYRKRLILQTRLARPIFVSALLMPTVRSSRPMRDF